jgi:hypothetical protein
MKKHIASLLLLVAASSAHAVTGVIDGQAVNAATTNAAFLGKNGDDSTTHKLGLLDTDVNSGTGITNAQRELNAHASILGASPNQPYNSKFVWGSDIVGAASDSIKARIEALVNKFSGTTGHAHSGVDGDGPKISATNLNGILPAAQGGTGVNSAAIFPTSGTVATIAGTQVITNKDIDGGTASNTSRFTLPKDTLSNLTSLTRKAGTLLYATDQQKPYFDNGTALTAVGSGSGSGGGVNYIANPDAETDASGCNVYNDSLTFATTDVNTSTDTITVTGWNKDNNTPVSFSSTTTLPGGITAGTTYYTVSTSGTSFKISTSIGGSAVDLTSTGSGTHTAMAGTPFDGTGGTSTLTCTRTTTSPLRGGGSFLFTKTAANSMGQGWEYDFSIATADLAKMVQASFEFSVASGTYSPGSDTTLPDLVAYVYGPTDGTPQLTQLTPYKVMGGSGSLKFQGNFQTAASGVAYRLILHEALPNSTAYTLKSDSISVSPVLRQYGTPVTDWQSFTMQIQATTTNPTKGTTSVDDAQYRRVGDSMALKWDYIQTGAGSTGSGQYIFPLPNGAAFDTTKVKPDTARGSLIGFGHISQSTDGVSNASTVMELYAYDATHFATRTLANASATNTFGTVAGGSGYSVSTATISYHFNIPGVPIQGWSSSTQMSDQSGDNRIVAWTGYTTSTQTVTPAGIQITNWVSTNDSHAAFSTGSSSFTIPSPGYYTILGSFYYGAAGANNQSRAYIKVNGVDFASGPSVNQTTSQPGSVPLFGTYKFNAGDVITFYAYCQNNTALIAGSANGQSVWSIIKYPGNQQTAASEGVSAKYWATANGTSTTSTPFNFDGKVYDSHNAVTTGASWGFKAPSQGKYSIKLVYNNNAALGASSIVYVYKNGSVLEAMGYIFSTAPTGNMSDTVELNAGDVIDLRTSASYPWAGNASRGSAAMPCSISIEKVAN